MMFTNLCGSGKKDEKLDYHDNDCDEAPMYDSYAIEVHKQAKYSILVVHLSM